MSVDFDIVIPARYASQRLPGKPLRPIHDRPMIEWVHRAAVAAGPRAVIVATDDPRIVEAVSAFGGQAVLTDAAHPSGTDRIVEVADMLGWDDARIVVNLQGDEPLMPAANLRQVALNLEQSGCDMATLHKLVDAGHARDPNQVKLVHDAAGCALYFSRSSIPFDRAGSGPDYCGHIGLYAYRVGFIRKFSQLPPAPLEICESLEQLRALYHGYSIHTAIAAEAPGPGVDTEADLARVVGLLEAKA